MNWWNYVERTKGSDTQDAMAAKIGVKASSVSRWKKGGPDPRAAAALARAYGRPVLEAFVAAGFLTADEAKVRPAATPSLADLSDDELVAETERRVRLGSLHKQVGKMTVPEIELYLAAETTESGLRAVLGAREQGDVRPQLRVAEDSPGAPVDDSWLDETEHDQDADQPQQIYSSRGLEQEAARGVTDDQGRPAEGKSGKARRKQDQVTDPNADDPDDMEPR